MLLVATLAFLASPLAVAVAQRLTDLPAGARVRTSGDRATNDGIQHFRLAGLLVAVDTVHLAMRRDDDASSAVDTIALLGVHRLEVFRGLRSRRDMIVTGAMIGGAAGVIAWLVGRQTIGSAKTSTGLDDNGDLQSHRTLVETIRISIPLTFVAGGLLGALLGREHWERVPVPWSEFPGAR
jgi:hypothetical protein